MEESLPDLTDREILKVRRRDHILRDPGIVLHLPVKIFDRSLAVTQIERKIFSRSESRHSDEVDVLNLLDLERGVKFRLFIV